MVRQWWQAPISHSCETWQNLDSVVVKGLPKEQAAYWAQRNKKYDLLRPDLSGH